MRTTLLVALGVTLALSLVALPGVVTETASANSCTPYLLDGDTKGYVRCAEQQCNWEDFPNGRPVCTD